MTRAMLAASVRSSGRDAVPCAKEGDKEGVTDMKNS